MSKHPALCWFFVLSRDLTATSVCLQIKIEHNLLPFSDDYLNQQIMVLVTDVGEQALAFLMQGKQSYFLKTYA